MQKLLIIFTRYPEPGKTKTRLIPVLGAEGAAALHRQMAERILSWAKPMRSENLSLEIRVEGETELIRNWLGSDLSCREQGGGDLGLRMSRAFEEGFQAGFDNIVLIGTDCPGLSADLVRIAFARLASEEAVLGPANDGGYYLIGLHKTVPALFENIPWGTAEVLHSTLDLAAGLRLRVSLLEPLDDIDRPEDLRIWKNFKSRLTGVSVPAERDPFRISIIIPTLNEEENIAACLSSTGGAKNIERIVVDGGSRDRTPAIAEVMGAKVLASPRGRAVQMNAGAREASGEMLVFLHADTRLPAGFARHIVKTLQTPGVAAGAFEFRLDSSSSSLRFIERVANWRSRRLQLPYGDQAIFLRAPLFRDIGGFPEIPIMEDVELIRRLQKAGRIETLPAVPAITSARRWRQSGVWKTTIINELVLGAYCLGIPPGRIYSLRRNPE